MNKQWLMAGALALVSTSAVAAEDRGFFVAVNGGQSKYDISKSDLDSVASAAFTVNDVAVLPGTISSFDDTGSSWSIVGGYRFLPFFSVEAGYIDLGRARYRMTSNVLVPYTFLPVIASIGVDVSARGPFTAVSVIAPLGDRFDVHAHAGAIYSEMKLDVHVKLDTVDVPTVVTGHSADFFAGVGAAFRFTPSLAATLDYTGFRAVGDPDTTGEGDIAAWRVGLQYTFRH